MPLPTQKEMKTTWEAKMKNGAKSNSDRIWDRDEVHEIYQSWRKVFNEYDPPLTYVCLLWWSMLIAYTGADKQSCC
jgi:alpha-glucosidase